MKPTSKAKQTLLSTTTGDGKRDEMKNDMAQKEDPALPQLELRDRDVLCTKDKTLRHHPGNCYFRDFIDNMLPTYKQATSKLQKMNITKAIVDELQISHGIRFVKFDDETASWVVVDTLVAREKVGHAIRFAIRREEKQALKASKKSSMPVSQSQHSNTTNSADSSEDESSEGADVDKKQTGIERPPMDQEDGGCATGLSFLPFQNKPPYSSYKSDTMDTQDGCIGKQDDKETARRIDSLRPLDDRESSILWTTEDANFLLNETSLFQGGREDHPPSSSFGCTRHDGTDGC
ncbi:hypothetical protein ACA910_002941 [Epithemia clementina (nom. ined.)]